MPRPTPTHDVLAARFHARVLRSDGCWLWQGALDPNGYGRAPWHGAGVGRTPLAHRVAYALAHGLDPRNREPVGLEVGHSCHVRACVRPDHLYACTREQNEADKTAAGRRPSGPSGKPCGKCDGPLEGESRRGDGRTFRYCVPCRRVYMSERRTR